MLILLVVLLQMQGSGYEAEPLTVAPGGETVASVLVNVGDTAVEFHPEKCAAEVIKSPPWLKVSTEQAVFEPAEPGTICVRIPVSATTSASGSTELRLRLKVYYCNNFEGWCRTDTVEVVVPVRVSAAAKSYTPPPLFPLIVAVVLLVCAFGLFFLPLLARFLLLCGFALFAVVGALLHREHKQAHHIATQLCVSCIGLEHTYILHGKPQISDKTKRFLAGLKNEYELVSFTAEWCTNCPFAKAVVKEFVRAAGGRLSMRVIDVEKEPKEAAKFPIEKGGRVVLPAVAVIKGRTVRVIFGAADLERRLTELLRQLEGSN